YRTGNYTANLARTDGTAEGFAVIRGFQNVAGSPEPQKFTAAGDRGFFSGDNRPFGREPGGANGTPAGTALLRDIMPGQERGSGPNWFINYGGTIFFTATGPLGTELWRSDGTTAGTVMVTDLNPGPGSGAAGPIVEFDGYLYFVGND